MSRTSLFWSEWLWVLPNHSWDLLEEYRHFDDIYYSLITALIILGLRLTIERTVFAPIGIYLGLKSATEAKGPIHNVILEKAYYTTKGNLSDKQVEGVAKQLDWSTRQVRRWLRQKSSDHRPTVLSKFTESAWRFTAYSFLFIYGCCVLWDKPWMWDSKYCFTDYPHHRVSTTQSLYYNLEIGLYLSLLLFEFFETKRKDYYVLFVHHVLTLTLCSLSWTINLTRFGTLAMIIHDFANIPFEAAKILWYLKYHRLADSMFFVFTISWLVTRLIFLPYQTYNYIFSLYSLVPILPFLLLNVMWFAMLTLQIIWTWFIMKIWAYFIKNKKTIDVRSDDEESSDDDMN